MPVFEGLIVWVPDVPTLFPQLGWQDVELALDQVNWVDCPKFNWAGLAERLTMVELLLPVLLEVFALFDEEGELPPPPPQLLKLSIHKRHKTSLTKQKGQ